MSTDKEVVRRCKTTLEQHYGLRLKGVILYGSLARNQADSQSDIDLLVLLDQPFDYFSELRQVIDLLYTVQLDSNRLISAKPVPPDDFERGTLQFYRNAKREGMLV